MLSKRQKRTATAFLAVFLGLTTASIALADGRCFSAADLHASSAPFSGSVEIPQSQETKPYDHWFVIEIAGQAVGYSYESLVAEGTSSGAGILVKSGMKMVLNRLGAKIELDFTADSIESRDGILQSVHYEMTASELATVSEAFIDSSRRVIEIRKKAGSGPSAKAYVNTIEFSGTLLGPEGSRRLSVSRLKNPGDSITFETYSPELEKVVSVTHTVLSREKLMLDVLGPAAVAVFKVEETISGLAAKRMIWTDASTHHLFRQDEPGPFGLITVVRSDKTTGLAAASGGSLPEEMYSRSIARTNIRLPRSRLLERLRIKISLIDPSLGLPDMGSDRQAVVEKRPGTLILEIRRPDPNRIPKAALRIPELQGRGGRSPVPAELGEFLEPNAYVQSDDPEIRRLSLDVIGGERDVYKAAKKLERWTAENMTFDLGIVFAPSSEIFKNRRGTCVGYATLLATLCRAAGIPSRVLLGLAYTHGIFGGHAWTEILAGDRWVPLDAAIPSDGPTDAARFSFAASSLKDGAGTLSSGASQQVFGNVHITILEYAVDGLPGVTVPQDAKPYRVEGNRYENPWLGLALEKPRDFVFSGLDSTWPDLTIVTLVGPGGRKASLQQVNLMPWWDEDTALTKTLEAFGIIGGEKEGRASTASGIGRRTEVSGLQAFRYETASKAAFVIRQREEAWILTAEGDGAAGLLDGIVKTMSIRNI